MFVPVVHGAQKVTVNYNSTGYMENRKNNEQTITRGYRLKPRTHKLIQELQKKLNCAADGVIWEACENLCREVDAKTEQAGTSFKTLL